MRVLLPEGTQEVQRVTAGPKVFATTSPSKLPRWSEEDEEGRLPLLEDWGFTAISDPKEWGWMGQVPQWLRS